MPAAEALIADPALDLIFILTPDHLHAPLLEQPRSGPGGTSSSKSP
jgi:hypothetical protein